MSPTAETKINYYLALQNESTPDEVLLRAHKEMDAQFRDALYMYLLKWDEREVFTSIADAHLDECAHGILRSIILKDDAELFSTYFARVSNEVRIAASRNICILRNKNILASCLDEIKDFVKANPQTCKQELIALIDEDEFFETNKLELDWFVHSVFRLKQYEKLDRWRKSGLLERLNFHAQYAFRTCVLNGDMGGVNWLRENGYDFTGPKPFLIYYINTEMLEYLRGIGAAMVFINYVRDEAEYELLESYGVKIDPYHRAMSPKLWARFGLKSPTLDEIIGVIVHHAYHYTYEARFADLFREMHENGFKMDADAVYAKIMETHWDIDIPLYIPCIFITNSAKYYPLTGIDLKIVECVEKEQYIVAAALITHYKDGKIDETIYANIKSTIVEVTAVCFDPYQYDIGNAGLPYAA